MGLEWREHGANFCAKRLCDCRACPAVNNSGIQELAFSILDDQNPQLEKCYLGPTKLPAVPATAAPASKPPKTREPAFPDLSSVVQHTPAQGYLHFNEPHPGWAKS